MKRFICLLLLFLTICFGGSAIVGCDNNNGFEEAGEGIKDAVDAVDDADDELEDAGDDIEDGLKK